MRPNSLDQLIINDLIINDGTLRSVKTRALKAMVNLSNRSPKEIVELLGNINTEASQALNQKSLSQDVFIELVSELERVLHNYCESICSKFFTKLKNLDSIDWMKKHDVIENYFSLESDGKLIDTLKEIDNLIQKRQPAFLNEWNDLSSSLLAGHELMIKMFADILHSTKTNDTFDDDKLSKLLKSIVQYHQWSILKLFLDLQGKNFPVDVRVDNVPLLEHVSSDRHIKMSSIVTKYLILLECSIPKTVSYDNNRCVGSLPENLRDVYGVIMDPNSTIPFFRNLPTEIKLPIALQTLRAKDRDLSYIPDELLANGLHKKELHAKKKSICDVQFYNRDKTFLLAIRKFREYCQFPMDNKVTKDKLALLKQVADKKLPDMTFTKAQRLALNKTFKHAASDGLYLSKPAIKNVLDTFIKKLDDIYSIIDRACVRYYRETGKAINLIDQDDLVDKLTLVISKHENNLIWDANTINNCASVITEFLKETAKKPEPVPTPGLFQNSLLTRMVSTDDIEKVFLDYLAAYTDRVSLTH